MDIFNDVNLVRRIRCVNPINRGDDFAHEEVLDFELLP